MTRPLQQKRYMLFGSKLHSVRKQAFESSKLSTIASIWNVMVDSEEYGLRSRMKSENHWSTEAKNNTKNQRNLHEGCPNDVFRHSKQITKNRWPRTLSCLFFIVFCSLVPGLFYEIRRYKYREIIEIKEWKTFCTKTLVT